jgi:hypothetical protein
MAQHSAALSNQTALKEQIVAFDYRIFGTISIFSAPVDSPEVKAASVRMKLDRRRSALETQGVSRLDLQAPGTNTFDLSFTTTPFAYYPALGNLLPDVDISSSSGGVALRL